MIKKLHVFGIAAAFILCSCGGESAQKDSAVEQMKQQAQEDEVTNVKRILFSVPSPLESAFMIQDCGIPYKAKVLHDITLSRQYASTTKKALNLGVFITDLSYSNVFGNTSNAVNTFKAIEDLSNQLDLDYLIDDEQMKKFDEHINNRDELLKMTTKIYTDVQAELAETDMEYVNALIVTGAWVEGMYITTSSIDEMLLEYKVVKQVANQKQTLTNIALLLAAYKDVPEVEALLEQLKPLETIYNNIEVVESKKQVEVNDAEVKVLGESELKITKEQMKDIQAEVTKIRTSYVEI